jgi:hypothetical protein
MIYLYGICIILWQKKIRTGSGKSGEYPLASNTEFARGYSKMITGVTISCVNKKPPSYDKGLSIMNQ